MKKLTTVLIALALAACTERELIDNAPDAASDVQIVPAASIWSIEGSSESTPMSSPAKTATPLGQATTRAAVAPPASFKVTAYAGTAVPSTNLQTTYFYDNTVNVSGNVCTMAPLQYFPANGAQKLYFYAYAPAATTLTAGNGTTAPVAKYTNIGKTDILWINDARGLSKGASQATQTQPNFSFQHRLMKVCFKIVADASFETGKTITSLALEGMNTTAELNIIAGTVTFNTTGTITLTPATPVAITTTATEMADYLMVQPTTTLKLTVVADGVTYSQIPVTITTPTMTGGSSHLITLTFKRNAIVPTASMVDWTTGGNSDVGVI